MKELETELSEFLPAPTTGRADFFVRSLAPTTGTSTQNDCFDRLLRLEETEQLDDATVHVWGDGICTNAPEMSAISETLATITDIYSFSAEVDASITSFFRVQRVDASLSGESFERIVPPHRTLLLYEDETLTGVFPCRIGEETYTPLDAIEQLEASAALPVAQQADATTTGN